MISSIIGEEGINGYAFLAALYHQCTVILQIPCTHPDILIKLLVYIHLFQVLQNTIKSNLIAIYRNCLSKIISSNVAGTREAEHDFRSF